MKKYVIQYRAALSPINDPVTKLGGQPVWIDKPQWPIGTTGAPLMFVGQFEMKYVLSDSCTRLGYVFFSDDPVNSYYGDADKGDCVVILQPGGIYYGPTQPLRHGPTVYKCTWSNRDRLITPCEFAIDLTEKEEEPVGTWDDVDPNDEGAWNKYFDALIEDKVGGRAVPTGNTMGCPLPVPDDWRLLVQLNSEEREDFFLSFGGDGTGWAFVSPDGRSGKFWFDR